MHTNRALTPISRTNLGSRFTIHFIHYIGDHSRYSILMTRRTQIFPRNSPNRALVATYMGSQEFYSLQCMFSKKKQIKIMTNVSIECECVRKSALFSCSFYIHPHEMRHPDRECQIRNYFRFIRYALGCSLDVNACHKWDVCRLEFRIEIS